MDWVHCNNCFSIPDSEKSFFLTSCGHIYCRDCEEQCARGQCKLCGNQCSSITLSSTMKPDVQVYFTDPDDLLKKKLKEVHQVSEFQKSHRARLISHQKKQIKKFKSVKDDFRKLLKNLKELDSEKRRLSKENDVLKKFIGMQRNTHSGSSVGSVHRSDKGHVKSPHDGTPPNNLNSMLSKFTDKFDDSKSQSGRSQRVCVISPPRNGKLGIILNTPSPSTALKRLNISSSHSNDSRRKIDSQYATPNSTPGSSYSAFVTPQSISTLSPLDQFTPSPPTDQRTKASHYKKDVRKLVVHPYSPND